MQFLSLLEHISNIPLVLLMFLRGHFEAILHCVAFFIHFTIHLRVKLLSVFDDFDVLATQKKRSDFRSQSLCVDPNACLTCQNFASGGDF